MSALESYTTGVWRAPTDAGAEVRDASTGEVIATVSSSGVDFSGTLAFARTVGVPAIQRLTFHQRAAALKSLASHLGERKEEIYALSFHTGATRADSQIDIEGGIGTLFAYASLGRRELPDGVFILDGAEERLSKRGGFVGQHIFTSLQGAAVQINAFNFPVWGFLEKFAPAFLAGMPSILKPATPTAYVAAALIRQIIESQILPEGSVQLIAGGIGDLFDHLTPQDAVSFTGSAETAHKLRAHPTIVSNSTRFNAEGDSLNCSILGPDAGPDTPEFHLYVDQLVTEMRVKAGQKCTGIRRALVPDHLLEAVVEATNATLDDIVVGHPASGTVTMGPLVSLEQRDQVRQAVIELERSGASLVHGDPAKSSPVDADAERGAFMAPLLLVANDSSSEGLHRIEAFGPVATVMSYRSTDDAISLAAQGGGSLVGSVVTADSSVARAVVLGLTPWHGRILILDRNDAKESTGHGTPLVPLVHGGPGRAGGGEELGGVRAILSHMQRSAVQGSPDALTAVTGKWVTGSARDDRDIHPFRKYFEDLRPGDGVTAGPRTVTLEDIERFAELTGDTFYAHMDEEAAKAHPFFGGRVAHGYFVLSAAAGLFVEPNPGPVLANYGLERLRFIKPVYPGDSLTVALTCKRLENRDPYGEVTWDVVVTKQDGEAVAAYDILTLVAKRP